MCRDVYGHAVHPEPMLMCDPKHIDMCMLETVCWAGNASLTASAIMH